MTTPTPLTETRGTGVRHYRDTLEDAAAVRELLTTAIEAGEVQWITQHEVQPALDQCAAAPGGTLLAEEDGDVVGVFLTGWSLLLVAPQARRRGHGRALVRQALAESRVAAKPPAALELSPPVGNAVAEAFARSLGFAYMASFWRLRLAATTVVPGPTIPQGYTLRHLRPGADDAAYMQTVTSAFVGHTPAIVLTPEQLQRAYAHPDFSPDNIAVVVPDTDPTAIVAVGRVQVTPDGDAEVDLLGVLAEQRGLGLGRELLRWAVTTLRERGHGDILLNVEGGNASALTLYTNHGFQPVSEWPRWTLASAAVGSH